MSKLLQDNHRIGTATGSAAESATILMVLWQGLRCYRKLWLGLLVGVLTAQAAWGDEPQVRQQLATSLQQYSTAESWAQRREALREGFLRGAGLWPLPERPPVRAIRHSRREHAGYSVENVALETIPGFFCTGNLYQPLGRKDLGPGILCPHGHFRPLGRYRQNHQIRCAQLARMGATVFSYSMVGWQDSQQTTHDDPRVLALQTWNSLRVVDYLSGLDRVDPRRVAITGASGGGTQTFFLSLIDRRIRASAPLVIVYPWSAPQGCLCEGGLPVMQSARTNAIELAAASAPRPQLLISVGNDPTENFPQVGFPFIKQMYAVAGAEDKVSNIHFADEGHDFGPSKRAKVYEFLAQHLDLKPDGFVAPDDVSWQQFVREDLSKITIESPAALAVFNDQHPLPNQALNGSEAVARSLDGYLRALRAQPAAGVLRVAGSPQAGYSFAASGPADEALIFTPAGFDKPGIARLASGSDVGQIDLVIRDARTGQPTPCRVNVVGPEGDYYQPHTGPLSEFSFTGVWPKAGWGNRQQKAPIRYLGRFFYSQGNSAVRVPAGHIRVEVWKGFEYRPTAVSTYVNRGQTRRVEIELQHAVDMPQQGYWSGDPHIHIQRRDDTDEQQILDLMQAEDIHFGSLLAYNEPAGPYAGIMNDMDAPQFRGLGPRSVVRRDNYEISSGQEYRTGNYGHLNLFLLDQLVRSGQAYNANHWPPYGQIAEEARQLGGVSFYAHGGYAKEIYADVVQGKVDGVELLQFGVYRGIGLIDWYHMLNAGFRVPASGACDYPACRKLGDCKTFVWIDGPATTTAWLRGMAQGESFVSSGPLLLLDVQGQRPGGRIDLAPPGPHQVTARVRVRSEVAPVTHIQLLANGRVLRQVELPPTAGQGAWIELEETVELSESAWIAARAFSQSSLGTPDAEAHTNPVYVYLAGRAPYNQDSLDRLVAAIDRQIALHKQREFPERAKVVVYFERSRDILMRIREAGGVASHGHPADQVYVEGFLEDPGQRTHTDQELKAFLRPLPPRPLARVLESFETVGGFKLQLVAHEPLVYDPIAAAFDAHGNLYVCEMQDYPYKPQAGKPPLGRLRLLRDTDGDGVFDQTHVFADKLLWAGGVAPWKGGVFVAAPPNIWYLKDTDGDYRADVRQQVYTGFGTANQQAMLNNLTWGLDHKIYGSTAGNGGNIRYASNPQGFPEPVSVHGHDFRFDPLTTRFEAITGTVQFGNTFDDWGNRFLCSESRPLLNAVLPQRYLERNPFLPVPSGIHNLTPREIPIFRISPLERWRMIRSSRRIAHGARSPDSSGASHHVIDAAAGVTIYRGGAYPPEYYGNVFIGGAQNNVIHRRVLSPQGVTFDSARGDPGVEFVRSSDNWFRPVNFINAPDGTLYVLDMSREILETIHVPLDVTKFLDFKSGRQHGRIYRLAPPAFSYPGPPQLGKAATSELVEALASPHGWYRDTAHRLLFERQDLSAVPALRAQVRSHLSPQTRLHALWSLRGLNQLADEDVKLALADPDPRVQEHALRLAEDFLQSAPSLLPQVIALSESPEVRLQFQAAFTLGESPAAEAARALARLATRSAEDRWIRTAILSSANGLADQMFVELLSDSAFANSSGGGTMLSQLATIVGARRRDLEVNRLLETLAASDTARANVELRQRLLQALAQGLLRSGGRLAAGRLTSARAASFLKQAIQQARRLARSTEAPGGDRRRAIQLLGTIPFGEARDVLAELLAANQSDEVQIAATQSLAGFSEAEAATILLSDWQARTPAVRSEVIAALLARPARTQAYLEAVARGEASVAQIDLTRRSMLLKHPDQRIRELAERLFSDQALGARSAVLEDYRAALSLTGNETRGKQIFTQHCANCHRIGDTGHAVGPSLTSSATRDPQTLLVHVLAPNQYVLPNFENYVVVDTNGRVYTGMLAGQSATSVTLKREESRTDTILRGNIDELTSTGKSLMPEGFEQKIDKQSMSDLIAFLQLSQATLAQDEDAPLHIGTLPGLIEPD